jgi:hypothetical protein
MASVSSALFSTQMYDGNGNMTRPWVLFFSALAAALTGSSTETGGGSLLFTVPGTIGIRSNAAPLIQAPDALTFSTAVALVKQAPAGAAINVIVRDAGNAIGTVTIAAGATSGSVTLSSGSVSAGDLLTIDITTVGTTFPGSDLTVQLQP